MKKYSSWIVVAVVLIVVYYFYSMMPASATVVLAELNGSGVSGSAKLTEDNGNLVVAVTLTGGTAGVAMPAHVHEGQCPGVGGVKYPLMSVENGNSTTTLTGITLAQVKAGMPLAINVHKSVEEVSVYVACGAVNL